MAMLAKLKAQTEKLKNQGQRRIFVSSATVQAYRVAHEKKERLTDQYPLILTIPSEYSASSSHSSSLQLVEGSVGPDLTWSLTAVNHVLRTVSKWGEPTYLFANILDNDPQAFVAVTLRKGTPPDELSHLDSVLSRTCQFHVAETRPMQLSDAGQVVNALGKGLMAMMGLGGSSSSSSSKHQQREQQRRDAQLREQQQRREAAERTTYLASRGAGGGGNVRVDVHGRPVQQQEEEADERPSAPVMLGISDYYDPASLRHEDAAGGWGKASEGHTKPLGVDSRQAAADRLAALKEELAKEGTPPSAPDVHARPEDSTSSSLYTADTTTSRPQQQQPWDRRQPGVLSNPYATGTGGSLENRVGRDRPYATAEPPSGPSGRYCPSIPHDDDAGPQFGYNRGASAAAGPYADAPGGETAAPAPRTGYFDEHGKYRRFKDEDEGYRDFGEEGLKGSAKPWGESGALAAETEQRLKEEAELARREWEQAQREAQQAAQQRDDGGWGSSSRDQQRGGRVEQQQQKKQQAPPDWLDVLGKVFGGGPAYAGYAPDL